MAGTSSMFFVVVTFVINLTIVLVNGNVRVESDIGTIVGQKVKTRVKDVEYTVKTFKGIPFAKPPVGELRFQKTQPMETFEAPFEAFEFGSVCHQPEFPGIPAYKKQSEDCLFLNVYVPEQDPDLDAGHAVMIWFHGGGLTTGAGESYPGEALAAFGNVIVVTINYRIGIFGFMDSQDGTVPGNLGLHDQHLAIKWVNTNIGAFRGDNTRVTIFGQSAGGSSVVLQAFYPANERLFQRVIQQSGVLSASSIIQPDPRGSLLGVAKEFECSTDEANMKAIVDCLKAQDANSIMDKLMEMYQDPEKALLAQFYTTIDGEIIKATPSDLVNLSKSEEVKEVNFFRSLDFTSGFTDKDGAVFLMTGLVPVNDLETFSVSREDFLTQAVPNIMAMTGQTSDAVKSMLVYEYTNWNDPNSVISNRDQFLRFLTDIFLSMGSVEMARFHSNNPARSQNTYTYVFSAETSNRILHTPSWMTGANHGDELGFEFLFQEPILKNLAGEKEFKPIEDWEYQLAYTLITYFTNFAKSGDPNKPVEVPVSWPKYENVDQHYINIEKAMSENSVGKYFYGKQAHLWLDIIPEVGKTVSKSCDHHTSSPFVKKDSEEGSCDADGKCDGD